jgi:hypothetical protein
MMRDRAEHLTKIHTFFQLPLINRPVTLAGIV